MSSTSTRLADARQNLVHHQGRVAHYDALVAQFKQQLEAEAAEARTPRINVDLLNQAWEAIEAGIRAEMVADPELTFTEVRRMTRVDGWDQGAWRGVAMVGDRCQSTRCAAGWVTHLDAVARGAGGWLLDEQRMIDLFKTGVREDHQFTARHVPQPSWLEPREDDPREDVRTAVYGTTVVRYVQAETRAKRLLGLTDQEAHDLFVDRNNLDTLRLKLATLRAEELTRRARHDAWVAAQATDETTVTGAGGEADGA